MVTENVLCVPRSDSEGDYILVNATSNGPSPLDLRILATEGEAPYVAKLKQSRISKLRHNPSQLPEEDWEVILSSSLLQRRTQEHTLESDALEKLEVIAKISGDVLTITFRKNISGITQKLGEIGFKKDEGQEIDSVSWAATAVQRATLLQDEVQDLARKYSEQNKRIEKLNQQLEEFIEAKKAHEDSLLEKFRELLNTKKLKIRDQQRLLAGAKVDSKQAAKVKLSRTAAKSRTPVASRASKRKANGAASASASEEDGLERMPAKQKQEDELSEQTNTPEHSDQDVTEDEDDDDLDSASRSNNLPDRSNVVENGRTSGGGGGKEDEMQFETPPPARELPFEKPGSGGGKAEASKPAVVDRSTLNQEAGNEDDETDDDDEL